MTTLAILTSQLEALCDEIDDREELPPDLLERFADTKLEHSKKVGAYVATIESLKNNTAYYKDRIDRLTRRVIIYENIEREIKTRLMIQIKEHPDLPWKSDEGDKIKLQNNAEKLVIKVPTEKRHLSNVLLEHTQIPVEYIIVNTFYTLNSQAVKAHLQAGNKLGWAELERGQHIRIY